MYPNRLRLHVEAKKTIFAISNRTEFLGQETADLEVKSGQPSEIVK